jgi:hypothetical protein
MLDPASRSMDEHHAGIGAMRWRLLRNQLAW